MAKEKLTQEEYDNWLASVGGDEPSSPLDDDSGIFDKGFHD